MDLNGIKAAIFDLDGTIADSMGVWDWIDNEFFRLHNIAMPDDYKDSIKAMDAGKAAEYTKKRFKLNLSVKQITDEWFSMSQNEYTHNVCLKPFAAEFIRKLDASGMKIGLATATARELFEPLLKRYGILSCFDEMVTTEECGKDKNSPDIYLLCAKKLSVQPHDCMVFEDILAGVKSAKIAGMKVIGVFDKYSASEKTSICALADCYIDNFGEMLNSL